MKILFLLALLASASLTEAQTLDGLRQTYAVTNLHYFDNKLPKDTKIELAHNLKNDLGESSMAQTICTHVVRLQCRVLIDPDKNPTKGERYMTLFHEMCHVKLWDETRTLSAEHGPLFQACMTDLADRGAFRDWW